MASTDAQLIAAFLQTGQQQAFEELTRRHIGKVRAIVFPMVLDGPTADDLTQDVFLSVFRNLRSFRGKSAFSTWLYRVAVNRVRSHQRQKGLGSVVLDSTLLDSNTTTNNNPEQLAIQSELETAIFTALKKLAPKYREAIVLVSLNDLPVPEAAKIEGCTTATMYWRLHEARRQLKQLLQGYLEK